MAEDLYEQYAGLFDQQVHQVEDAVVGIVRAAFGDFSSNFKQHLQSLVPRRPQTASGDSSSSQPSIRAQEEIEAARDSAQRQIATALAHGFGAIADFSFALGLAENQPSISESFTRAGGVIEANNNADNSDDDSLSIKSEDTSECESDCESHSDDEIEIKKEEATDEMAATADTSNVNSNNNDTVSVKTEIESDYCECDRSDSDSSDEEEELTTGREIKEEIEDGHSNGEIMENSGNENGSVQVMEEDQEENETRSEPGQAGPSIVSNTASILTRRSARASTAKKVNNSEAFGHSLTEQQGPLTGTRKRTIGRSRKSNAPKRSRVAPASTIVAAETDQSEDEEEDEPESEAISLSIIVRRLNCRVPGCKKVFPSKVQLDGHLLAKHSIEKYACKVKDCTESYATRGELTTHRNAAHDSLNSDWLCGQCETTCPNYNQLAIHTYQYHECGLFACSSDKCDFTAKTRIKVQSHQLKHRPAKYRCTYAGCTASFYTKSHLTAHFRVHSKETPFPCSQCPRAFAHKSHLTVHERLHSGVKPYSCTWPHCGHSASQQSDVISHIRGVHFGLPRYQKDQTERGIIDNRDARVFLKKTNSSN